MCQQYYQCILIDQSTDNFASKIKEKFRKHCFRNMLHMEWNMCFKRKVSFGHGVRDIFVLVLVREKQHNFCYRSVLVLNIKNFELRYFLNFLRSANRWSMLDRLTFNISWAWTDSKSLSGFCMLTNEEKLDFMGHHDHMIKSMWHTVCPCYGP